MCLVGWARESKNRKHTHTHCSWLGCRIRANHLLHCIDKTVELFGYPRNNKWLLEESWAIATKAKHKHEHTHTHNKMAINTKSGADPSTSAMASGAASSSTNDLIELNILQKKPGQSSMATPILKRKGGGSSKKLQFSTPEFSVTPIATVPGVNTRLIPSRRR